MHRLLLIALNGLSDRRGATSIEYGLIVAVIAIAAIVSMNALGGSVLDLWTSTNAQVAAATTTP